MKQELEHNNILLTTIKESYFNLLSIILKNLTLSPYIKAIFIIVELLQLLHLPFQNQFLFIWINSNFNSNCSTKIIKFIKNISSYLTLYPLVKGNKHIYLIFLIISIILILVSILIIVICCYKLSISHFTMNLLPKAIGLLMVVLSSIMFTPLIMMLLSTFIENVHIALTVVCICVMIIYVLCMLFIVNTLIDVSSINEKNILSVNDCYNESLILLCKVYMILASLLVKDISLMKLFICVNCAFIILLYINVSSHYDLTKPFLIYKIQSIFLCILLWMNILFLIGMISYNKDDINEDRSPLILSFITGGILIIIGFMLFSKRINIIQLTQTLSSNLLVNDYIKNIHNIIHLCLNKDSHREYQILLNGYLYLYTRQYNEQKSRFSVLVHIESIFNHALRKYPFNVSLRIEHAIFLKEHLYKYDKALLEVINAKHFEKISICEEFMLFILKKELESKTYEKGQNLKNSIITLSSGNNSLTYKALSKKLITLINKVSLLYIEFWTLLLNKETNKNDLLQNNTAHNDDTLKQLNDLGEKINDHVENINNIFNKTQKINPYDFEIISHYALFHSEILNDRTISSLLKTKLRDLSYDPKSTFDNKNLNQLDLNKLVSTDDICCIIFGADENNLGIITHISLRLCIKLGYTKGELIGRNVNVVLPEIFVNAHNKYMKNVIHDYKNKMNECYMKGDNGYEMKFKDIETFYKNKSKYLIHVNLKVGLFKNEKSSYYFIHKIISFNDNHNNKNQYNCYVLTNKNLSIQHYSTSAITYLNLRSHFINKTITDYIKQFQEDYLKLIVDHFEQENKNLLNGLNTHIYSNSNNFIKQKSNINKLHHEMTQHKIKIRNDLLKTKYFSPNLITWIDSNSNFINHSKDLNGTLITSVSLNTTNITQNTIPSNYSKRKSNINNNFVLTVHEYYAYECFVGYLFEFEVLWYYNQKKKIKISNVMLKTTTNYKSERNINKKKQPVTKDFHTVRNIKSKKLKLSAVDTSYHNNEDDSIAMVVDSYKKERKIKFEINKKIDMKTQFHQFVDKSFVPILENNQIVINPISLVYEHYLDNDYHNKRNDIQFQLKEMALRKLNKNKQQKEKKTNDSITTSYENYEEEEEEEDDEGDEVISSSLYETHSESSKFSKELLKHKKTNIHFNERINTSYIDNYYHVKLEKVKLFIYNYNIHSIFELAPQHNSSEYHLSQMELRMIEEGFLHNTQLIRSNSITSPKPKRDSSNSKPPPLKKNETIIPLPTLSQHDKLIKEIDIALKKNDSFHSICLLYITSIISCCIICIKFITYFILIKSYMTTLHNSFITLTNTYTVTSNYLLSLYYVREVSLCNISDYKIEGRTRDEYLKYYLNKIDELFMSTEKILSLILVSKIQLSDEQEAKLDEVGGKMFYIKSYNDEYYKGIIYTRFRTVISTINIALSHISNSTIEYVYPYSKDIYFYLENGFNSVMTGLTIQNEFFKQNVKEVYEYYHIAIIVLFILIEMFYVYAYLVIRFGLKGVIKKKNSYLTVFFEISSDLAKHLLTKCEKFLMKSQKFENEEQIILNNSDLLSRASHFEENENFDIKNENSKNRKPIKNINKSKTKHIKEKNYSKDIINTSYELIVFIFMLFIVDCILLVVLLNKYIQIQYAITIYISENNIYFSLANTFNILREFLLDEYSTVEYTNTSILSTSILNEFHPTITKENEEIRKAFTNLPRSFYNTYYNIYHSNICTFVHNNITTYYKATCEEFTDQVGTLGLDKILMYFAEDLRNFRGITISSRLFQQQFNFIYNYSMYGTPPYESTYLPKDPSIINQYIEYGPFSIFNSNMHYKLKYIFHYLIFPSFHSLFTNIMKGIYKNISIINLMTTIQVIIEGIILIISFLCLWLRFVKELNKSIYKTKNMLTIIPRDVLASVWNIRKLLDIEKSSDIKQPEHENMK